MPLLAFVDAERRVQSVAADGSDRSIVFDDCGAVEVGKDSLASGLAWSRHGARLACLTPDGTVLVSDLAGQPVEVFGDTGCSSFPKWSFDSTRIACTTGPVLQISDEHGGVLAKIGGVDSFGWAPAAGFLAYRSTSGELRVVYEDGDPAATVDRPVLLRELAWGRTSGRLAVPLDDGVRVLELDRGTATDIAVLGKASPIIVGWTLHDSALIVIPVDAPGAGALILDVQSGGSERLPVSGRFSDLTLSSDGRLLAYVARGQSSEDPAVRVVDVERRGVIDIEGGTPGPPGYTPSPAFRFSTDGSRLCWVGHDSTLFCSEVSDGSLAEEVQAVFGPGLTEVQRVESLNPTLQFVAFVDAGELRIARVDQSDPIVLGPVLGTFPFAWRSRSD